MAQRDKPAALLLVNTRGMDEERFDFLTHEQFKRLSQKEKVAYLERASAEVDRLRKTYRDRKLNASARFADRAAEIIFAAVVALCVLWIMV